MSAHIIIAGGPVDGSGATTEDHPAPLPRAAAARSYYLMRVVGCDVFRHREPVSDRIRIRRGPALRGTGKNIISRLLNPARIQFLGAVFRPLRSLLSHARIKFLAEQFRGEAPIVHVSSFPIAPELQSQQWTKGLTRCCQSLTRNAQ